jgi:hypothetical protein
VDEWREHIHGFEGRGGFRVLGKEGGGFREGYVV